MASTMKSAVCGTPLSQKTQLKPNVSRSAVVVRASAEDASRRSIMTTIAAAAALVVTKGAYAIDIVDDRKVKGTGYDIIYEARDLSLPQNVRDGLVQYREDLQSTKARVTESIARLKKVVPESIQKKYWWQGREEIRRQLGTLRFDLDTIASSITDKASRKAAIKTNDEFFKVVEKLDDALRNKDQDTASKAFDKTVAALGSLYLG